MNSTSKFPVWKMYAETNADVTKSLAKALNVSTPIASMLIHRGIDTFDKAKDFFRPSIEHLHDPFLMKDMDKAVDRLTKAIQNHEKILIYGDYDVDGTTSVALVYGFLKKFHTSTFYYIPDRYKEGYGVSMQAMHWAQEKGIQLIISLDCGIKANEPIALANEMGIDFIVCDHHKPDMNHLPEALAILDAKRDDCQYPYKELSGCGVGFKFMSAYCIKNQLPLEQVFQFIDLLAVSIAADIVPITGENRVLTYLGLKKLNEDPQVGLKALIDVSGFKSELNITNVVFGLAPRINAAGRIDHAYGALDLLIETDFAKAKNFSEKVNDHNINRKELDSGITQEALALIESDPLCQSKRTSVLYQEHWHKGVIGIVASRCIEKYYRPTIVLTKSHDLIAGSARSVLGFDLHEAISQCSDLLEQFGGHMYAAGLALKPENLEEFKLKFEQVVANSIKEDQLYQTLWIDEVITLENVNAKFHKVVEQMAPFGPGNMQPIFMLKSMRAEPGTVRMMKEEHVKFEVRSENSNLRAVAVAFGMKEFAQELREGKMFDICFQIQENIFRETSTLQLLVKDIKFVA